MTIPMPHRRFTIAEVEQMLEVGILHEDDRLELIDEELIEMSPLGIKHVNAVNDLTTLLVRRTRDDAIVQVQNSIRLSDGSAPEPDFSLVRATYNRRSLPRTADVFLVIEVAESSRDYDRNTKFPRYAAAGIPEAWLFDLLAGRIERHSEPGPKG
jgi:Uma2 family endonuclease